MFLRQELRLIRTRARCARASFSCAITPLTKSYKIETSTPQKQHFKKSKQQVSLKKKETRRKVQRSECIQELRKTVGAPLKRLDAIVSLWCVR